MYHGPQYSRYLFSMMAMLLLAGCGASSGPSVVEGSDTALARKVLARAALRGPVQLAVRGDTGGLSPSVLARAVEDGVRGLDVDIEPASAPPEAAVYLAFAAGGPEGDLCRGDGADAGSGFRLGLCEDGVPVAIVTSEPSADPLEERDLWQAAARLFPDDYNGSYGFGWLGNRVSIGVGLGF